MKMPFVLRIVLGLIFSLLVTVSYAAESDDLDAMLNAVRNMQADFTQTIFDNKGKAVQQSFGSMAFQRPGQFRWQVKKPIPQLIIANKTKLWVYDPDLEQVTIRALSSGAGETPALLLSHDSNSFDEDFHIQSMPAKKGLTWFKLTPKQSDNMFEFVEMGFSNNQINQMRLQDHLGHTTLIEFKNIKTNSEMSPGKFSFNPPANTDVIDETKIKAKRG
jgi:outer membrane lipoprotein carrier protein